MLSLCCSQDLVKQPRATALLALLSCCPQRLQPGGEGGTALPHCLGTGAPAPRAGQLAAVTPRGSSDVKWEIFPLVQVASLQAARQAAGLLVHFSAWPHP